MAGQRRHAALVPQLIAKTQSTHQRPKLHRRACRVDPAEMPKDMEFESLLTVGPTAFERKTGEDFDHVSAVSYESFSNKAG